VYVGGGSMLGLLAVWRALGLDRILLECWEAGVVLAGLSAGAMCWFESGITTSLGRPAPSQGLGFLPGSMSVHADGEPARLPVYRDAVATGAVPPGYAADDGVALLFRDAAVPRRDTRSGRELASRPPRAAHRPGRRN
jgi:peptidase E